MACVLGGFGRLSEEGAAEEEEGAKQVQTGGAERPEGEGACHDAVGERDERKGLSKTLRGGEWINPEHRSWRHLIGLSIGRSRLPAPWAASNKMQPLRTGKP